ncbi:hypothetical protein EDB89DRAFT_2086024 [Lactarius sanguifluus]|nr:hypothetical protein EDB89DRAFT_2086024 [Lactarius sanguifluus]
MRPATRNLPPRHTRLDRQPATTLPNAERKTPLRESSPLFPPRFSYFTYIFCPSLCFHGHPDMARTPPPLPPTYHHAVPHATQDPLPTPRHPQQGTPDHDSPPCQLTATPTHRHADPPRPPPPTWTQDHSATDSPPRQLTATPTHRHVDPPPRRLTATPTRHDHHPRHGHKTTASPHCHAAPTLCAAHISYIS